jgi:hypothetical protein
MDIPLQSGGLLRQSTDAIGIFGGSTALVIRITPAGADPVGSTLVSYEWGTGSIPRFWTLSRTPCDFDPNNKTYNVDKWGGSALRAVLAPMAAGGVWYINGRNWDPRSNQVTCRGDCPMAVELYAP